ncbi:hypothetical protein [Streptomyces sp. NPDC088258]|uniref:hypothetical protein n=1 Tax=Streptomyces sp. NPDC088258 TaxID=3365849 RepID=UPI00381F384A
MKFMIRPARSEDAGAVSDIVLARSAWLEDRGLPSWRDDVELVRSQARNPDGVMRVLEADGRPIGCTTVTRSTPPMAWADEELAEPALYLYTNVSPTPSSARGYREPSSLCGLSTVPRVRASCGYAVGAASPAW